MNQILKNIQQINNWKNLFDSYAAKNQLNSISSKLIDQQNFQNFQNFIEAIVEKGPRKSKKRWVSNERRILHIILNCICVIQGASVQELNPEEMQRLNRVFSYKEKHSVQYEVRKLSSNSRRNRRRWSRKQEKILFEIVQKSANKNKWNEIARQLFISSKGEYFRQGKHCRERFYKLKSAKGSVGNSQEVSSYEQLSDQNQSELQSFNSLKFENRQINRVQSNIPKQILDFGSQIENQLPIYNANSKSKSQKTFQDLKSNIKKSTQNQFQSNIKISYCIGRQKENQIIVLNEPQKQIKLNKPQIQVHLNKKQNKILNHLNENTWEALIQKNHGDNNAQGNNFPVSIQSIHVGNLMTSNTYFPSIYPINYAIWPISFFQIGFER